MKVFITLLCLTVGIVAHSDLNYTDRFQANKMTRCQCENVTLIDNFIALVDEETGVLTSDEIQSRTYFNAATITYLAEVPEGAYLQVEISVANDTGQWQDWQKLATSEADLHFKGSCQSYRYRITFQASEDGHSPKLREIQIAYDFIYPHMMLDNADFAPVKRGISKPSIISRSGWKARSAKNSYSYHNPSKITIHHTYRPLASSFKGASTIRGIQNYHMDSNGWSDIGYHFLIGAYSSGQTAIYQGRPENVLGAHTGGANTNNVGVNLIGDYDIENVNPNAYKVMIHTLAWLCDKYGISSNRIYGHKDFKSTLCPGRKLYNLLPQIRRDVSNFRSFDSSETADAEKAHVSIKHNLARDLSGAHWIKKFPPSRKIKDLNGSFQGNTQRFYNAMINAGARIRISNTLRPPQRAFLMHYAFRISREGLSPRKVPTKSGVNIEWWHGSTSKSVSAAKAMVRAYNIAYRPSLTSNHIRGQAIDMTISWSGTLRIKNANGTTVFIGSPRSGASNRTLWKVGASYGVYKLASDAPHWSYNGH